MNWTELALYTSQNELKWTELNWTDCQFVHFVLYSPCNETELTFQSISVHALMLLNIVMLQETVADFKYTVSQKQTVEKVKKGERWKMSAPHTNLSFVLSVCQKSSKLVEICRSYGENNFAQFFWDTVYYRRSQDDQSCVTYSPLFSSGRFSLSR